MAELGTVWECLYVMNELRNRGQGQVLREEAYRIRQDRKAIKLQVLVGTRHQESRPFASRAL